MKPDADILAKRAGFADDARSKGIASKNEEIVLLAPDAGITRREMCASAHFSRILTKSKPGNANTSLNWRRRKNDKGRSPQNDNGMS